MANSNFVRDQGLWVPVNIHPKDTTYKDPIIHAKSASDWKSTLLADYTKAFHGGAMIMENIGLPNQTLKHSGTQMLRGWSFFEGANLDVNGNRSSLKIESPPALPNFGIGWQVGFSIERINRTQPLAGFKGIIIESSSSGVYIYSMNGNYATEENLNYIGAINLAGSRVISYDIFRNPSSGNVEIFVTASGGRVPEVYGFPFNLTDIFKKADGTVGFVHPCIIMGSNTTQMTVVDSKVVLG